MGKPKLRKVIQLASEAKQPGFEPKSVRHFPVSFHCNKPRSEDSNLGLGWECYSPRKAPKFATGHDAYCLLVQAYIWKD